MSADDATPAAPDPLVERARAGDQAAFGELFERHRREIRVHCYRMLGSFTDAEDLVQETFLRAWRRLSSFEGRSTFRAWLYKIATNACLDTLKRAPRRCLPFDVAAPVDADGMAPTTGASSVAWIEPFPDALLAADEGKDPAAATVAKETIELAFLAAIQHLPPRQRAILVLRDVLGWPARDVAALLDTTVTAVKSALQRARPVLRDKLGQHRHGWVPEAQPDPAERAALARYMDAHARDDIDALAELLLEDVRVAYPQIGIWCDSRDVFINGSRKFAPPGEYRFVACGANLQPAVAIYLRAPDDHAFRVVALEVLRIHNGRVAEIVDYYLPELFGAFGLPDTL